MAITKDRRSLLFYQGMNWKPVFSDPVALVVSALLLATGAAFASGLLPYPFGALVLSIVLLARVLYLGQRKD